MNFYLGEIIGIDKPYGISSFKALAHVRYHISRRIGGKIKTGHAGTLDPLATGVLIICTGKATKKIEELQQHTKEYIARLQLGATTASYDLEQPVDATYPTEHITLPLIEETLRGFIGQIEQIPPIYSACKVNGKRAYKMARKGKEVELKAKTLIINELELLAFDAEEKKMDIRVVCSKGTYIRALARDIGLALESGAYLTSLRRTRVGDLKVENCISLKDFPAWLDEQSIETEIES